MSRFRICLYFYIGGRTVLWMAVFMLFIPVKSMGQKRVVVGGIQYKPIFPVGFLGTGKQTFVDSLVQYDVALRSGFNGGMVIRKSLTDMLSLETGISYVKRNYELSISDSGLQESSRYRIIGYEIPVSLLVYIRLGEFIYMNASMGISPDMFASNVQSLGENHRSRTVRRHTIQPAVLANLGWEARTQHSGYFYLGASFHRPFNDVLITQVDYTGNGKSSRITETVSGSYLTFDIRYFFPQGNPKKEGE